MLEAYRCPFCQRIVEVDLTRELDRGQTDLRERIDPKQNLKIDMPKRLFVTCTGCSREFIVQTESIT